MTVTTLSALVALVPLTLSVKEAWKTIVLPGEALGFTCSLLPINQPSPLVTV